MPSVIDAYHYLCHELQSTGIEESEAETFLILSRLFRINKADVFLKKERFLPDDSLTRLKQIAAQRAQRVPLAYILGVQEFWSLDFEVTPAVLIPRPETELLVEEALRILSGSPKKQARMLDIGTGSGAIPIVVAKESPSTHCVAVDISPDALMVAQRNAVRHRVENAIFFIASDLANGLCYLPFFDVIVSNPPYIPSPDLRHLAPELGFEPRNALDGGPQGIETIERMLAMCHCLLKPDGWILLEIGANQAEYVGEQLTKNKNFARISLIRDYAGLPRIIKACKIK